MNGSDKFYDDKSKPRFDISVKNTCEDTSASPGHKVGVAFCIKRERRGSVWQCLVWPVSQTPRAHWRRLGRRHGHHEQTQRVALFTLLTITVLKCGRHHCREMSAHQLGADPLSAFSIFIHIMLIWSNQVWSFWHKMSKPASDWRRQARSKKQPLLRCSTQAANWLEIETNEQLSNQWTPINVCFLNALQLNPNSYLFNQSQ